MDTFRSITRNPDAPGTGTRTRRWRRWGVVALAALLAHGIAVIWVARSHQVTWPPAPEQVVPTLLLQPEPVHPPAPPAPAPVAAKPRPPAPRPHPQHAPTPTPEPAPTVPDMADTELPELTGTGAQASADTGVVTDLGAERPDAPAAPPGPGFALPPSATLHYATYVNGVRNENGMIRWATDGKTYTLAVEIPLPLFFGALAFRSTGNVDAFGLAPLRYEEVRGRRQPDVTTFHRTVDPAPASGTPGSPVITFTRSPSVLPLPNGVQDRFSVFLQLTGLGRGNPSRLASQGVTLDMPIADTDSVELARVQRVGEDMVDTPDGAVRAEHFVRLPRREGDARRVEIWLAPERGWLPVRLRQTEPSGMQFELVYLSQDTAPNGATP
ncbi:DUF3108 domain-containing protein [Ralstonia sp. SM1864_UCD524_TZ4]|uniref:DUF3108 domain-containing protein n=1 Tax=Ralstonia solanacearum TaxID=305 RepID=A0A0S4VPM7_RALSL|nr:DUF3108 domain-containing protein [Ralstonia pseudosolanacearum]CUV22075.1 conserved protein of unknown function [Ralstonia solanacearum]CUV36282.1 conserved protein of unknown function [Ralstonia solanacearum]CUV38820.1 conserved protein of unknown function [Ralstonia solanacearum]CUV59722.1 conserved protein of unknown function [Ralstonia solanacearum]